jgi:hypothetical protein
MPWPLTSAELARAGGPSSVATPERLIALARRGSSRAVARGRAIMLR